MLAQRQHIIRKGLSDLRVMWGARQKRVERAIEKKEHTNMKKGGEKSQTFRGAQGSVWGGLLGNTPHTRYMRQKKQKRLRVKEGGTGQDGEEKKKDK